MSDPAAMRPSASSAHSVHELPPVGADKRGGTSSQQQVQHGHVNQTVQEKFVSQVKLLLWKRYTEMIKQRTEIAKVFLPPVFFFLLIILMYEVFLGGQDGSTGSIEVYFVPLAFWVFAQKIVVTVMFEKVNRLHEAMKMMGMMDAAYWVAYFIFDGVLMGISVAFLCMIMCTYGLFNHGNLGTIFGFILAFFLALTPFCYFLCCFFDTPQTSGQITLGIMLGFYVLYMSIQISSETTGMQAFFCLFPPLAFQLGCASFNDSYSGIPMGTIGGMMIADTFIYAVLAWYFTLVWPSDYGVRKPFWFIVDPAYWFPAANGAGRGGAAASGIDGNMASPLAQDAEGDTGAKKAVPLEAANETILGAPSIKVDKLRKTFSSGQVAVNDLSFSMYANQIFVLLGHNGAGKTTTINMLTGLLPPDYFSTGGATIYGYDLHAQMDSIRRYMGVCPQHDVLFEALSVHEHILLFSQLKGNSYEEAEAEVVGLTTQFHLHTRLDHTGSELSGGQKRKLSVAIAVCGGSKFIVLDEPTAGMDPLARRELWDLLASLRQGRTMLLTTHYMDEADVLGDRVAIMSLGELQCLGSTHFLKQTFGAGYRLICNHKNEKPLHPDQLHKLTTFVQSSIPEAQYAHSAEGSSGAVEQSVYMLPFDAQSKFGAFFTSFDDVFASCGISSYGVQITSMEDVFLKVGEDHTVTPKGTDLGIGSDTLYEPSFHSQVIGICARKLRIAKNDIVTIPLVGLPTVVAVVAAALYYEQTITNTGWLLDMTSILMYIGAYLGIPGLMVEFIVREREDKLRTVLTIMGCDFKAYWIGTFIADYLLMSIPMLAIFISWIAADMNDFLTKVGGMSFFVMLVFTAQVVAFSYVCSYIFTSPKSAIAFMPMFIVLLILTPLILLNLIYLIFTTGLHVWTPSVNFFAGVLLWGIMLTSPHGALFTALLDVTVDVSGSISSFPPVSATIIFMMAETVLFMYVAYHVDSLSAVPLERLTDENFNEAVLNDLDDDVKAEREKVLTNDESAAKAPLRIERLRKVFPPKRVNGSPVVATQDVAFAVKAGEIFGLLGANGAGKTTTLSMLTRHLVPTSGDGFISGKSILSQFSQGAKHMGVVTQNNSLWELLSVEDHLYLFARLRGVPEDRVAFTVNGCIDQLELTPHRKKLAGRLSGGMKRKLCVAIALIGDPEVVLLDEPSAGLDPVSRRNLWNVILQTMSHRAVVLTTHSMEEAEALCGRIAIMVRGQIRALGTKQHLKVKFGSGYELCIKLLIGAKDVDPMQRIHAATEFVTKVFPHATILSENGGLVTYQIPKEEMVMGKAFTELERNKENLGIEDYSIAQPTLEQVFIRTVVANTPEEAVRKTSRASMGPIVIGGSTRMTTEALVAGTADTPAIDGEGHYEFVEPTNPCGCVRDTVKWRIAIPFTLLFLIFQGTFIATKVSVLIALSLVCLVVACVGCNMLCCPCCQPPKGDDE